MICHREGCKRTVPPGRRKYCSEECSKIVNRRSAAERSRRRAEMYRRRRLVKYAPRTCLACGDEFSSEGPWNRICSSCSDSNSAVSYSRSRGNHMSSPDPDDELLTDSEPDTEDTPDY